MAALDTVTNYVSAARTLLQDTSAPYRYSDADLLGYLNQGLQVIRRLRPDLFISSTTNFSGTLPQYASVDSTTVSLNEMYRQELVLFMTGMVQLRDDEGTQDKRAGAFLDRFTSQLTGLR